MSETLSVGVSDNFMIEDHIWELAYKFAERTGVYSDLTPGDTSCNGSSPGDLLDKFQSYTRQEDVLGPLEATTLAEMRRIYPSGLDKTFRELFQDAL